MIEEASNGRSAIVWALDDEPEVIASLGALLDDSGFNFVGFTEPIEFLQAFRERGETDLVLVDLNLPNRSGAEVIREIRGSSVNADVPIVVLTAMSSEASLLNAFEAGADDVVRKPYSLSELLARLTWQLSRADRLRRLQRKNADLLVLTRLAQVMSRETTLGPILGELTVGVAASLAGARANFFLVDRESELVSFDPEREGPKMLDFRDLREASDCLAARKRCSFHGKDAHKFAAEVGHEGDCTSGVLVPMTLGNLFVGAMIVTSRAGNLADNREHHLISIISDFAAVANHRARLFQSVMQESARIDQANRELARTKDFLSNVIDSSPDAIVVSDKRGRIVVFNAAAEAILGVSRGDAVGNDVRMLYPDRGAERVKKMLVSDNWGGRGRLESSRIELLNANGDRVPVLISASFLDEDALGDDQATVGVFTDIRNQIQMEEKLQAATESLERSRRQALIAELAGAAAHEINQPLTSLLGYSELLESRIDPEDPNRRAFETILSEAQRIADIVRKIGRITEYKTKEYVGGARIFDLDSASEVEVDESEGLEEHTSTMATRESSRGEFDEFARQDSVVAPDDQESE
jgi:PAS domain S-box-containing protein